MGNVADVLAMPDSKVSSEYRCVKFRGMLKVRGKEGGMQGLHTDGR